MVEFRPFRALRPLPEHAAAIASLPYDVMDTAEARREVARHPLSFVHVERPEVDLPPGTDPHAPEVYAQARRNLDSYEDRGLMAQDDVAMFYVYRQTMDGRSQTGLVGLASVDEYLSGVIRRHELTRADKEEDRVRHVDACDAHSSPVFLTYRHRDVVDRVVADAVARTPVYDFTSDDGVRHTLWLLDAPADVAAIRAGFAGLPHFYVADGHHRTASAARVGLLRRAQHPGSGEQEYDFFMAVAFPDDQLHIMAYHRVVADLNGLDRAAFLSRIRASFRVSESGERVAPRASHQFGMYLPGQWYLLEAHPGSWDAADPVATLDVSILQDSLLRPVLGIEDPRTDTRIDFVGGIRGLGELERRVDSGRDAVAFSLHPTSMEELMAIADAGRIMPPKSTWFEPKLRSGLFVHRLR